MPLRIAAIIGVVLGVVLGVVIIAAVAHLRVRRRIERWWRDTHPLGPSGIIHGAESIGYAGGPRAALLLHGFGSTPRALSTIAAALRDRGWTVRVPLLPGHGRLLESFRHSRRSDWLSSAREAYDELAADHVEIALVGTSMGGALAVLLAAERDPRALVLLAPYLSLPRNGKVLTTFWPLWQLLRPYVSGNVVASIHDPAARTLSLGYGRAAPRTLLELRLLVEAARAASGAVRAPTLAIFSTNDYRISRQGAEESFMRLGAPEKALRWVERSGHVISVDYDRETVTAQTVEWLEQHVPSPFRDQP
jgi:carboxylesterase